MGMTAGRPTKYEPEYAERARAMCVVGATDDEIADYFEVNRSTIYRWKLDHPEFCSALKAGKSVADDRVERSLYQKATGYNYEDQQAIKVKVSQYEDAVEVVNVTRHAPAETTAAIFWLKNRRPDLWRDKTETEHSGTVGHVIDTAKLTDEQLAALASIPMADQK